MTKLQGCTYEDFKPYMNLKEEVETVNDTEDQNFDEIMRDERFQYQIQEIR